MTAETIASRIRTGSVRTQIIVGFGLILGLTFLIVLINYAALQNVEAGIEATVDEASRVRELGLDIQNSFLLARQEEQLFLGQWRVLGFENAVERHVTANREHLAEARAGLAELDALIETRGTERFAALSGTVASLSPWLEDYEAAFLATVNQIEVRTRADGLENQLADTLEALESAVTPLADATFLRLVLQISANEQAFFNTGQQQYVDQTRLLLSQFRDQVSAATAFSLSSGGTSDATLLSLASSHASAFDQLVTLQRDIDINTAIFEEVTTDIAAATDQIGEGALEGLRTAREQLQRRVNSSLLISLLVGIIALAVGVTAAYFLARRILTPLEELTVAAQKIGRGNLQHRVPVTGSDEFGALGLVFNQMTAQLGELIGSLEKVVADRTRALTTSFRVSRRLSTILDQEQLVAEVVEQIRSAFDYYHVHIYLFDESQQRLIMAGGTGEAGRAMLAAGHQLKRGQGLVGRAANRGQTILVSNVAQDPRWLPNPLLPATRSEAAVPITLGNRVLGVLDVQHDRISGLSESDAELLQSIANQVAIALQNASLYEEAQRAARREALVNAINQKIQQAGTVEGVLQVAAQELGQALTASRTSLQLHLERDGGDSLPGGRSGDL
jgi:putative methionine-R-sulfoxide reductase with GAF domain